jgi:hypothetical protein
MLIHPWDGAISETEWRNWLAGHDVGQLAVDDPRITDDPGIRIAVLSCGAGTVPGRMIGRS